MPAVPVDVRWEVAEDAGFARVVRSGVARAQAARAHTVHVRVSGLAPQRWYHYRFLAGVGSQQAASPPGRSLTAPAQHDMPAALRLAFASCQQFEQGHFGAYRHMADDRPDLVVFLGDYLYESSWGRERVRRHVGAEPRRLDDYRQRHAQYRGDPDLQRMHAAAPWLLTWDDHEVDNDYAADRAEDLDPQFLARRAAAYQAYFEHLPLAGSGEPGASQLRMHASVGYGRLARFMLLDGRQHRSPQACPKIGRGGGNRVNPEHCAALREPGRSMLGLDQERWLDACLAGSRAHWNLLAQQTLFAPAARDASSGRQIRTDGWDGYPHARLRLVESLARHRVANPLFLGGDMHANWVCDIHADFDDPRSPVVASEFCGTSITSQGRPQGELDAIRADNPHVRMAESMHRGYGLVELTPEDCTTRLRVVDDVRSPTPSISDRACFVVAAGRPGARRTA